MPTIEQLLEKKKFKKSSYRPWNYIDEIEKEKKEQDAVPLVQEENIKGTIEEQLGNEKGTIREQIINVEETNLDKIFRLTGHQKNLFLFIVERAVSRGALSTGYLSSKTLSDIISSSSDIVKTSLKRLIKKNLVSREKGKKGNGGFSSFCITEYVRSAALEFKRMSGPRIDDKGTIREQIENNLGTIKEPSEIKTRFSEEWVALDIEPLEDIGFSRDHVNQLSGVGGLDINVIQNSIYHFAFDLKYNNKRADIKKSTPLGYFMGSIRKFGVYAAPPNYESEKEKLMRVYYEQQKAEKERLKKVEDQLVDIAYQEWLSNLSAQDKEILLPDNIRNGHLQGPKEAFLRSYFKNSVWRDSSPKSHL